MPLSRGGQTHTAPSQSAQTAPDSQRWVPHPPICVHTAMHTYKHTCRCRWQSQINRLHKGFSPSLLRIINPSKKKCIQMIKKIFFFFFKRLTFCPSCMQGGVQEIAKLVTTHSDFSSPRPSSHPFLSGKAQHSPTEQPAATSPQLCSEVF